MEKRVDFQIAVVAWYPALVLGGVVLTTDASIRDFQQGRVGYVADAMEQALLLPEDMANLRSMRKYEVFLSLNR